MSLGVLIAGVWILSDTRAGLMEARTASLRTQGELIKRVLERDSTLGEPTPLLRQVRARAHIKDLNLPDDVRVRLFSPAGDLVADSFRLSDRVIVQRLPPLHEREGLRAAAVRLFARMSDWRRPWRPDDEPPRSLQEEVSAALLGGTSARERVTAYGTRVASVSIPIQHVQAVVGVITLESDVVDEIIFAERRALFPFMGAAAFMMLLSSILLTLFIARPVRRLALAADAVRREGPKRAAIPDLSERKDEIGELSTTLAAMTDALTSRIDAIERFAADVAHEIKNPLTSIRSAVETLPTATESQRARLMSVIRHDVVRIDRLINDISRASRVDAELGRARPAPLDLAEFLAQLVDLHGAIDAPARADVVFEGPRDGRRVFVRALKDPLGQVFHNLIDNARTFSPVDGVVTVRVERVHDATGAAFAEASVEDEGPGIPEANLDRIFERFFTERPPGADFGSHSGLGLAIAHQIVESHGGSIWAENLGEEGRERGARFVVRFPLQGG